MKRTVAKSLFAAAIALVIIVGVVLILTGRNPDRISADQLGDTVIGERTASNTGGETANDPNAQGLTLDDTSAEPAPAEVPANADNAAPADAEPANAPAEEPAAEEPVTEAAPEEPQSVDIYNEKEIALYVGGGGVMEKVVGEYNTPWTVEADIASFEAFNTDEPVIYYDNYYFVHQNYWDAVDTAVTYKIGYELSFDVNGEHRLYTILEPADVSENPDFYMGDYGYDEYGNLITDGITGYLGVWLYCDMYHDSTYIHLTQADMTDDTVMTSIKLRPTPQSSEISNLKLTAFSYSSDEEFNSEGHYIGTHGYEIAINNQ